MKAVIQHALFIGFCCLGANGQDAFVNFETAPVHPIALSPDGNLLVVCNLPDNRLEVFDVRSGVPVSAESILMGLDPVSVRFRTATEAWVVNHISSSVSVVDLAAKRVAATIDTLVGPADVVFAGTPTRAYVTCARVNTVQVFDPLTKAALTSMVIDGERPKAMASSADGSKVYVAIFESGNASTILAPELTALTTEPAPGAVEDADGPYAGQNPPPNDGAAFTPPINASIPSNQPPPKVSHIVKKNSASRWMDDNNRDWTEYISGTNSHLSGRIRGWDLPDHDLAVIDTSTLAVSYVSGLMNICMDVAVQPVSGKIAVVGTDGTNERRFESNLQATFLRVNIALIDATTSAKNLRDLNPHLSYAVRTLPRAERDKSLSDPRGIIWNSTGTRGYVTGMGSRNVVIIGADGNRIQPQAVELGEGPAGLVLDEPRRRLYVLNRFSASVSVVDTDPNTVLTNVSFFDPTPAAVKVGRKHFYDTRENSGLGHTACASCHIDGRMDRLAWDLGDPAGDFLTITNYTTTLEPHPRSYHPMKGPMVTLTLQDIIGHEPLHWRGDREGIEQFNQTFIALQGRETLLSTEEMEEFKAFLKSLHFPPNAHRNLDDTLPNSVPLPGLYRVTEPDTPFGFGDARTGFVRFTVGEGSDTTQCSFCHIHPTGLGRDESFFLSGPHGERNIRLSGDERTARLGFKIPQLRNMDEKVGLDFSRTNSRAGFGFMHDSRVDTLSRFLSRGFPDRLQFGDSPDETAANFIAFLFCFSGSDPASPSFFADDAARSQDVATAVGRQMTVTSSNMTATLSKYLMLANSPSNRLDLVVRGAKNGIQRGWYFAGNFVSDRQGEEISRNDLLALAAADNPLTFTLVPRGSGRRIGIDRDADGWFDRTEIEAGFDPMDVSSHGINTPPRLSLPTNYLIAYAGPPVTFIATAIDSDTPAQTLTFSLAPDAPVGASIDPTNGTFRWVFSPEQQREQVRLHVRVTDSAWPYLSDHKALTLDAAPFRMLLPFHQDFGRFAMRWGAVPGKEYRLQYKNSLLDTNWIDWIRTTHAQSEEAYEWQDESFLNVPQRYFRVRLEP